MSPGVSLSAPCLARQNIRRSVRPVLASVTADRAPRPWPKHRCRQSVSGCRQNCSSVGSKMSGSRLIATESGLTVVVEYENRRYNRDELDALGLVLGLAALRTPPSVTYACHRP